jgi:hypothetical protein
LSHAGRFDQGFPSLVAIYSGRKRVAALMREKGQVLKLPPEERPTFHPVVQTEFHVVRSFMLLRPASEADFSLFLNPIGNSQYQPCSSLCPFRRRSWSSGKSGLTPPTSSLVLCYVVALQRFLPALFGSYRANRGFGKQRSCFQQRLVRYIMRMTTLVYKRTHNGDPDANGCFGINDCMGVARKRSYDAVIGVGGIGSEAQANRIAGKINWIGIGAHKKAVARKRGPEVTFDHFLYFGNKGPDFRALAPFLAKRMYLRNVRAVTVGPSDGEFKEVCAILEIARNAPRSLVLSSEPRLEGGPIAAEVRCPVRKC